MHLSMQAWLQRFAWTEPNKGKSLVRRNSIPKDSTLLRDEPMFCFETAVKMLYWSAFVYEHEEVQLCIDVLQWYTDCACTVVIMIWQTSSAQCNLTGTIWQLASAVCCSMRCQDTRDILC